MPLHHGTAADFQAFDPARVGLATNNRAAAQASVWAALDLEVASRFALDAADTFPTASPQTLAPQDRANRPVGLGLGPDDLDSEVAATLSGAFDDGYDRVMLRNHRAVVPEKQNSTNILAVQRPKQLCSRFACFDPRLSHLRNLSAGVVAAGVWSEVAGILPSARRLSGLFLAGVDQPAAGAGDAVGEREDHQFADHEAGKEAGGNLVE